MLIWIHACDDDEIEADDSQIAVFKYTNLKFTRLYRRLRYALSVLSVTQYKLYSYKGHEFHQEVMTPILSVANTVRTHNSTIKQENINEVTLWIDT